MEDAQFDKFELLGVGVHRAPGFDGLVVADLFGRRFFEHDKTLLTAHVDAFARYCDARHGAAGVVAEDGLFAVGGRIDDINAVAVLEAVLDNARVAQGLAPLFRASSCVGEH